MSRTLLPPLTENQIANFGDDRLLDEMDRYEQASRDPLYGSTNQSSYLDIAGRLADEAEQRGLIGPPAQPEPIVQPPRDIPPATRDVPVTRRPSDPPQRQPTKSAAGGRSGLGSEGGEPFRGATRPTGRQQPAAGGRQPEGEIPILPPEEEPESHGAFQKILQRALNGGFTSAQFMYSEEPGIRTSWPNDATDADRKAVRTADYIQHYKPERVTEVFRANGAFIVLLARSIQALQRALSRYTDKARFYSQIESIDKATRRDVYLGRNTILALQALLERRVRVSEYYFSAKGKREAVVLDAEQQRNLAATDLGKYATFIFRKLGGRAVLTEPTRRWVEDEIFTRNLAIPALTDNKYYVGVRAGEQLATRLNQRASPMITQGLTTRAALNNIIRLSLKANPKTSAKETVGEKIKNVTRYPSTPGITALLATVPPADFAPVAGKKNVKTWVPNTDRRTLSELMTAHYGNVARRAAFNPALGLTSTDITSIIPFLTKYKNDPTLTQDQRAYLGPYDATVHQPAADEIQTITAFAKGASAGAKALATAIAEEKKKTRVRAPRKAATGAARKPRAKVIK